MASKEDRMFWQGLGICPTCHKRRIYGDEKECLECKAYFAEYGKRYYDAHKESVKARCRARSKRVYHERKENGLCPRCGSKFRAPGRLFCRKCLDKMATVMKVAYEPKEVLDDNG